MQPNFSNLTEEELAKRCNRGESEDSHDAVNIEGKDAIIPADGAEHTRPAAASPSLSQEDIERCHENRVRYGEFYDAWKEESPAHVNQELSQDIRQFLRKGGKDH